MLDKKNNSVDYSNKATAIPSQGANVKKTEQSNVIKIIQREWEKECERLDAKKNGYKPK